jgi:hypothetical protein
MLKQLHFLQNITQLEHHFFFNKPTNTCIIISFLKLLTKGIIINRIAIIVAQG